MYRSPLLLPVTFVVLAAVLLSAVVVLGCAPREPEPEVVVAHEGIPVDQEWAEEVRDVAVEEVPSENANIRSTELSPINSRTVEQLELHWQFDTEDKVTHQPIHDEGIVYFGDWSGHVYAVNAFDGTELWRIQLEDPREEWPWHGIAGTGAVDERYLYQASAEGQVWAIDKRSGEIVWRTRVTANPLAGVLGDLKVHDERLYVGLSSVEPLLHGEVAGIEPGFRGRVTCLDTESGEIEWELPLTEEPHDGATMWSSFSLDPNTNTLYFTTGHNYTGEASVTSDAMFAVDAETGNIRWVTQMTPHDTFTMKEHIGPAYAFAAGPQLFNADIDGQQRALVGAGQKSGAFWALDRVTGRVVWHNIVGYGGLLGGIFGEAGIGPNGIFVWSNNSFAPDVDPEQFGMNVAALDPTSGRPMWHRRNAQPAGLNSGAFLVNDLVLVASLDGHVRGYDSRNGETVWESPAHESIGSNLWVHRDMLLFGSGVPEAFGGTEASGAVYAYKLNE